MGPQLEKQKQLPAPLIAFRGIRKPLVNDTVNFQGGSKATPVEGRREFNWDLRDLFLKIPKTELHLHLSGSTPIPVIREILREQGMKEEDIIKNTTFSTDYDGLDGFLKVYYKIAWVVKTPEHFKKSAYQICMDAAAENVKYLEIRTSCIDKDGTPDEILQAVTDGINKAKEELKVKGFDQKAKIIVLAQRHHDPKEGLEHAKIAEKWSKKPDSLVVGFDVAGPESGFPITFHEESIRYAKNAGLKVTVHAGETPSSKYVPSEKLKPIFGDKEIEVKPVEAIKKAIDYGTDRLGHGVHLYDDPAVLKEVIDKQIPIESPPKCNVQLGSVKSYKDHPIKKMLDDGVNVSLSTDNRALSGTNLHHEYEQLYVHDVVTSWTDIKKLVMNGVRSVFLPQEEKQQLVKQFEAELKAIENDPKYKALIDKYLTPTKKAISFMGMKINKLLNNKAA